MVGRAFMVELADHQATEVERLAEEEGVTPGQIIAVAVNYDLQLRDLESRDTVTIMGHETVRVMKESQQAKN